MLLSPGKTPSSCLLPPCSLRMGVRMRLRSWLGRLSWCRRIVLPRPGSSLFQDSAVTRFIHVQSLPSRNAIAGGWVRAVICAKVCRGGGGGAVCAFLGIHHPSSFPRISFASVSAPSQQCPLRSPSERLAKLSQRPLT